MGRKPAVYSVLYEYLIKKRTGNVLFVAINLNSKLKKGKGFLDSQAMSNHWKFTSLYLTSPSFHFTGMSH